MINGSCQRKKAHQEAGLLQHLHSSRILLLLPPLIRDVLLQGNAPGWSKSKGHVFTSCGAALPCLYAGVTTLILEKKPKTESALSFFPFSLRWFLGLFGVSLAS
ncbi:Uncharacterized protein TCM_042711 [Theobroma cacao]|uniref:Uncharacterized protein n=1 Tax=Theobroma cacao TaxID=3641 RepID=A0A061FMY9_THECC|nr:Uncharacterized protein TCM_042711 [Theobroma cacao]